VASVAFYHIRRLKKVRSILGAEITVSLMSAFTLNRLDYCNTVLANLPVSTIAPLQRVQNAAARLFKCLRPLDHVTSALRVLHWLPGRYRITYKLCVLMHLVHTDSSPSYLSGLVTATANIRFRKRLRSPITTNCTHHPTQVRRTVLFTRRTQTWNALSKLASGLNGPQCDQTPAEYISV